MIIPYELKVKCIEANKTKSSKEIYYEIFLPEHEGMSLETFRRKLRLWKSKNLADTFTLEHGTYEGFTAHNATVQVDNKGNIRQAWIKQQVDENIIEKLKEVISEDIKPILIETNATETTNKMLEIPLFDMHFGVATFKDYEVVLASVCKKIHSEQWEEINIIVGQDLIHSNDMRGHTAKGTNIETVDIEVAWKDAYTFWLTVITKALEQTKRVILTYSVGNHDECISWCFVQALRAKFPQLIVNDTLEPRKCITWRGCFIGVGHCDYTNKLDKIFHDFVVDFPTEYANAKVREIHTGHLHRESEDNGIMVRRLATSNPTNDWHKKNGYVGAHKRFQLFVWEENWLSEIVYV